MTENQNPRTGKTFLGVSLTIFFAKLLGFCRDIVFAKFFGTGGLADLFQAVFSFPNLLFSSIGTALSSVNIPDLTYFVNQRSQEERNQYLTNLFVQVSLFAAIISLIGIVLAPFIGRLIAHDLGPDADRLAIMLTRIMMPTLLFVSLTFLATGVLQVHSHFQLSAAISVPFNILIIAGLFWKGSDVVFVGYLTTIGWFLQFLIQVPVLIKEKYSLRSFKLNLRDSFTRNLFRNMVPILIGNSLLQVSLILDRTMAIRLSEGTTAALSYGSNLFVTITSVFIVGMTTVVFPRLSQYCLEADYDSVRNLLGQIFKMLLFILVPYLLLVICYRQDIITLIYQRGAFDSRSTDMTSLAFLLYSFAVLGYLCQEVYNRVFYAMKNFRVPMMASLICLTLKFAFDYLFFRQTGIVGLSLSTSLALLLYGILMTFMLSRKIGNFINRDLSWYLLRLILPSAGLCGVVIVFQRFYPTSSTYGFLIPLIVSGVVYLVIAHLCGLIKVFFAREASR
ncbi:MAG: murein biosynthesis integral membrane protein MurJ [Syntrophomonas sp.]